MKESDRMIETILVEKLEQYQTRTSFSAVWGDHDRRMRKAIKRKKMFVASSVAFLSVMLILTGGIAFAKVFNKPVRTDMIEYPFVKDDAVIGKWEVVDFVHKMEYFDEKNRSWEAELYLNAIAFLPDGSMFLSIKGSPLTDSELVWTKDMIISKINQTASKYTLQEIDGTTYMFFEWKSGDYIFRNMDPGHYVLKQADTLDYSELSPPRREDDTNYPFEDDPKILGQWETVDFVDKIEQFNPKSQKDNSIKFLVGINVKEGGELTLITLSGELSGENLAWTKGLILNKSVRTASKYEIMDLDGDTYLFYEWKSGDYIFRNREPAYYVLKKVNQ